MITATAMNPDMAIIFIVSSYVQRQGSPAAHFVRCTVRPLVGLLTAGLPRRRLQRELSLQALQIFQRALPA